MRHARLHFWVGLMLLAFAARSGAQPPAVVQSVSAGSAGAGALPDAETIRRARAQLEANLLQQESQCRRGFWVNNCLSRVREASRGEAAELDRMARAIETQRRQQRAQDALERVRDKQQALEDRTPAQTPMTDPQIQQRLDQAQDERAEQAQERVLRQQQRQAAADQRHETRERAARERQERADRSREGASSGPAAPSAGSAVAPEPAR